MGTKYPAIIEKPERIGPNYIRITKDRAYEGKLLKILWQDTTRFPRQQNGQTVVVRIPIAAFQVIVDE